MKDEIKEILDKFDKVLKNYELDKKWGQMSVDSICHLFPSEMMVIKDYITNLQEKVNEYENPDDMTLFYMWLDEKAKDKMKQLQEENERLKELNVCVGCNNNLDYKSRNEKAIEYINTWLVDEYSIAVPSKEDPDVFCEYEPNAIEKLLNILNGGSNE